MKRASNTSAPDVSRMSFSYVQRATMPGPQPALYTVSPNVGLGFQTNRDPLIAAQVSDVGKSEAERSQSFMIRRQRPHPVLKPGPALSLGPDRAAFNQQLYADHVAAIRAQKQTPREQFIAARKQAASKRNTQERSR